MTVDTRKMNQVLQLEW